MRPTKDSIELSPAYGVNPSLIACAWCGESKGIALNGRIRNGKRGGDVEAPKSIIADYEPCDACAENWAKGVALLEVDDVPLNASMPPIQIQDGVSLYPTFRMAVIKSDAAERIFGTDSKRILLDRTVFSRLMSDEDSADDDLE